MARSAARAAAMQLVYENLMGGSGEDTLGALIAFTPEGDDQAYIDATVAGIESHAEELDALIARYSTSRELARIARVDLCILRVALYEMKYSHEVAESIAINEAVELAASSPKAKKISPPPSPSKRRMRTEKSRIHDCPGHRYQLLYHLGGGSG